MTKKVPKDKRIEEIVQASVDEFLENGFENASMEAIARRAGLSKGGLYHHFKSKDEILLHASRKLNEPVARMMQEALKKTSACQGLTWYIKNYLEYWYGHERELVFYSMSVTKILDTPVLWKTYENYIESCISFFKKLYERGIKSGEFVPHSAYDSALALMAAIDGIAVYLIMDRKLKLDVVISVFIEKFVYACQIKNQGRQEPEGR